MKRQVFYSFNYGEDAWRASQVRNMGIVDGNRPATDNEWQDVSRGGPLAIRRWINQQMKYRSALVVLIGANTANRYWINYEIEHAWKEHMGVVGVYINRLLDQYGRATYAGQNPLDAFSIQNVQLSSIVPVMIPSGLTSREVYADIELNISKFIERGIEIRSRYA